MARGAAGLGGLVVLLGLILASSASAAAGGAGGEVLVVYFRDHVVYDSGDLGVCGVNYVVGPGLVLDDLAASMASRGARLLDGRDPALVAEAVDMLRESVGGVLEQGGVNGRVMAGSVPVGGGMLPFALVSVPESSDVGSLARLLGQAAGRVEPLVGADVVVVIQVVPDDLLGPVDLGGLRRAVELVRDAVVEAVEVASGKGEPGSAEVALLAEALERLAGGAAYVSVEWPEPGFGDPLYISIDVSVADNEVDKEAVVDLVRAIRGLVGCEYPLVLGLSEIPAVKPLPLVTRAPDNTGGAVEAGGAGRAAVAPGGDEAVAAGPAGEAGAAGGRAWGSWIAAALAAALAPVAAVALARRL